MNDHFFIAQEELENQQLAEVIRRLTPFDVSHTELGITISLPSGRLVMSIVPMDETDLGTPEREVLRRLGARSCFCLSHRASDTAEVLVPVAQAILRCFGGWIGDDEDGFEPLLGSEDLESLRPGE